MRLYDISQELFSCEVFPGDPAPQRSTVMSIDGGDICNLTAFSMCAHNGTHIDAPRHFINDGCAIDAMPLEVFVGRAFVAQLDGVIDGDCARRILKDAAAADAESARRILIGGSITISAEAARVFAEHGVLLVGNEAQTVGPADSPMEVHMILLGVGCALLEGIRLSKVPSGVYTLSCAPLCLAGADGAPCRAVLIGD